MNIAFLMQPKPSVAFLYNDFTLRQALEKMKYHGYAAIPVLDRDGYYCGTVSEGDLLWFIVRGENGEPHTRDIEELEGIKLSELNVDKARNPSVSINADVNELLNQAMSQNFIPVTDDRNLFIGIVTRKDVIKHFIINNFENESDEDMK